MSNNSTNNDSKTYYEILQVDPTASELDIKKAYRRLALQYHPDRNRSSQEDTTQRFQEIGQAYECLSDATKRADYDAYLRGGQGPMTANVRPFHPGGRPSHFSSPFVDPFQQFDHLFRTDPFFQEAFQDLDDEFAKRFASNSTATKNSSSPNTNQGSYTSNEGWVPWLLRQCGIQVQMTSYRSDGRGGVSASHYSSTNQTSKETRTYVDNQGRQVTIRQMQRGNNQIQDKLVSGKLVERRVNGQVVELLEQGGGAENYNNTTQRIH